MHFFAMRSACPVYPIALDLVVTITFDEEAALLQTGLVGLLSCG
jgi:hypothetical protein